MAGDWSVTWIIVGISLLSVVIGTVWKVASWKAQVDSDRSDFKTRLDSFMSEIRADIKRIFERLPPASTVAGASPLRLTELGKKISAQLGAAAIASDLAPDFRERVAGKMPYEIQEKCFAYIKDEYRPPDEIEVLILKCAFENGIDRKEVLNVIAIELRDRLLPGEGE